MALIRRVLAIMLLIFIITANVSAKPVEETKDVQGEMMETAEGHHPFPPRFAMKRIKERREKHRAERRNMGQHRVNTPKRPQPCPQGYRRYVSILLGCTYFGLKERVGSSGFHDNHYNASLVRSVKEGIRLINL